MSAKQPATLPELHREILKLLWEEWAHSKHNAEVDGGLKRDEIFERLKDTLQTQAKGKKSVGKVLIGKSDTLKKPLKAMCDSFPNRLISRTVPNRGGLPFVYMINDVTTVTWPSTAYMLLYVWRSESKSVKQSVLSQAMLDEIDFTGGYGETVTDEEVKAEISSQIEWCISHTYLEYVEHHHNPERHHSVLHPNANSTRLQHEYEYLKYLANSVHRRVPKFTADKKTHP